MARGRKTTGIEQIQHLGDQAVLVTCHGIDSAQALYQTIRQQNWPAVQDVVLAYHELAVHFDPFIWSMQDCISQLQQLKFSKVKSAVTQHTIHCCYELGEDLEAVARKLKLTTSEVIQLHSQTTFTVYAIGFSPGFPYLGWLPEPLHGISRRETPRLRVPPGSVAIVGKQSAIYPQATPGGWALIGRTNLKLVDLAENYFRLAVGDKVQFVPISRNEFQS
ncbi:MAG: allophanate hydrolase subunit 1 [Planctomycetia bacterium]|nr:allophanate hydrolase subunit 1 [Planctomycetia bacterium]